MFRTEALRQRIELINHLVEFGRQVILIQGPAGFGKTTMLDAIEESAEPGWILIRFNAGPTLNGDSLLEKISVNLDFEPTEKFSDQEICDEIYRRLEILQKSNQIVVVVIDDAHELPAETHPLLLKLAHNDEASAELRVVLAADSSDSSLLDSLQSNAEQSALIHTVEIPRMDREQTASLLSWWQDQQSLPEILAKPVKFSSAIIDEIYESSEGIPGVIITLARQYRLKGTNTQLRADPVKKYIVIGSLAFLLVLVFSFFGKDKDTAEEQQLNIELPNSVTEETPPTSSEAQSSTLTAAVESTSVQAAAPKNLPPPETTNNLDKKLELLPEPATPTPLSNSGGLEDMLSAQLAEGVLPGPQLEPQEESQHSTPPTETMEDDSTNKTEIRSTTQIEPQVPDASTTRESSTPKPAEKTAETQADTPKISVKIRSQANAGGKSSVTEEPKPVLAKPAEKPKKTTYSLARLLRESPNGYVLQLFGVRNHDAATKYIAKHNITADSTVVASMHEGSPWYVVIYGQYGSRAKASEAIPGISQKLPSVKPWPRPISSLK